MAAAVEHQFYNSLPSLYEANKSREDFHFDNVINGPIRDIFLKYGVERQFCLYLLHRHHHVHIDKSVVKVDGTAHLMNIEEMSGIVRFGNKIVPTTWMLCAGKGLPIEFTCIPNGVEAFSLSATFISELYSVLVKNECQGQFGVHTMAKRPWSEFKIGDASVVVPRDKIDARNRGSYIPVAFSFDQSSPTFIVHGECKKDQNYIIKPTNPAK